MLHVAAQGDQPASMYYFKHFHQLEVNELDTKCSSALHWAAFSGNDVALTYLVAWRSDVNA